MLSKQKQKGGVSKCNIYDIPSFYVRENSIDFKQLKNLCIPQKIDSQRV